MLTRACASHVPIHSLCSLLAGGGCRAPLAPIPCEYSDELRELVEALLCKDPDSRPDMEHILQMPFVREHVKLYARHVRTAVTRRRESFKRSLAEYVDASEVRDIASRLVKSAIVLLLNSLLLSHFIINVQGRDS